MAEQQLVLEDQEQLRLLEIFHYILGTITCLFGLVGLLYVLLGVVMSRTMAGPAWSGSFSQMFAGLWIGMSAFGVVMCETSGVLSMIAGWKYRRRSSYWFCFAVAAINCLFMPVGTVLGVFSIIVLNRHSVKVLFQRQLASDARSNNLE
jgi:hypothetical protein